VLLVKGADFFLDAAVRIAHTLGVSEFAIGVSLVGFGTSIPELAAALSAVSQGHPELAVSSIIGSNIANIALVIGIVGILRKINVQSEVVRTDALIMMFAMLAAYVVLYNQVVGFLGGLLLIAIFLAYLYFLFETKKEFARKPEFSQFVKWFVEFKYLSGLTESGFRFAKVLTHNHTVKRVMFRDGTIAVLTLMAIILGAEMLIDGAIGISSELSIPENVIGLSLIAIGTSLPELSVSLSAVRRGMGNMLLGNIIGSNISNTAMVLGFSAIAGTLYTSIATPQLLLPIMLGISGIFVFFMRRGRDITKYEAGLLLMTYILFMIIIGFFCFGC